MTKYVLQKKRAGELRKESAGFPVGFGGGTGEENLENLELNRLEATTVSHLLSIKKKNALCRKDDSDPASGHTQTQGHVKISKRIKIKPHSTPGKSF